MTTMAYLMFMKLTLSFFFFPNNNLENFVFYSLFSQASYFKEHSISASLHPCIQFSVLIISL